MLPEQVQWIKDKIAKKSGVITMMYNPELFRQFYTGFTHTLENRAYIYLPRIKE